MPRDPSETESPNGPEIVVCVEHVARELSLATLIKRLLETPALAKKVDHNAASVSVAIRSLLEPVSEWPSHWQPKVVCVPYVYSVSDFGVGEVIRRFPNAQIVNLAFEQHLTQANKGFKCPRDAFARTQVTHMASGDDFRSFLLESGVNEEQIVVTGNLPCGLYRSPYHERFTGQREQLATKHDLPMDRPWVLFPENFAAAFFTKTHRRRRLKQGFSQKDLDDYVRSSQDCLQHASRWLVDVVSQLDLCLILRPRPAINSDVLRERIERIAGGPLPDNVRMIKDGEVKEWIFASDAVISGISSTLLEAAAADRRVASLCPTPLPDSVMTHWNHHVPEIATDEQLRQFLTQVVESAEHDTEQRSFQRYVGDALLPCGDPIQNLVRFMQDCVASGTPRRQMPAAVSPDTNQPSRGPVRRSLNRVEQGLRKSSPLAKQSAFGHDSDTITVETIQTDIAAWDRVFSQPEVDRRAA